MNRVCLTYSPQITNKLKSSFRNQDMQIVYRTQNKLCTFLGGTKDKIIWFEKSGIYQITCGCKAIYYGQSRRQVQIRYKEHLSNIKNNHPSKSSVAEHALTNLHLNFKKVKEASETKQFKLLKVIMNPSRLDAYESYYIHRHTKIKPNIGLINTDQDDEHYDEAIFGESKRGFTVLIIDGYKYIRDGTFIDSTNWRCSYYYRKRCKARAITTVRNKKIVIKSANTEHSPMCLRALTY